MIEHLSTLHTAIRAIHIGLGFAGLGLFWLILAMPKGTCWHVRYGSAFAWIAWVVAGSALISSVWALVHLDSFAPFLSAESANDPRREIYYFIFAILLYLSAATLSGAVFGIRVMQYRTKHAELRRTSIPFWLSITAATAFTLLIFGAKQLASSELSREGIPRPAYLIPVIVGIFGLASVRQQWNFVFRLQPEPLAHLYQHVWSMCGTGVAFHTAFLVFGANRMFKFQLPGAWQLIPWILPPVIGMTLTSRYIRKLRRASAASR